MYSGYSGTGTSVRGYRTTLPVSPTCTESFDPDHSSHLPDPAHLISLPVQVQWTPASPYKCWHLCHHLLRSLSVPLQICTYNLLHWKVRYTFGYHLCCAFQQEWRHTDPGCSHTLQPSDRHSMNQLADPIVPDHNQVSTVHLPEHLPGVHIYR